VSHDDQKEVSFCVEQVFGGQVDREAHAALTKRVVELEAASDGEEKEDLQTFKEQAKLLLAWKEDHSKAFDAFKDELEKLFEVFKDELEKQDQEMGLLAAKMVKQESRTTRSSEEASDEVQKVRCHLVEMGETLASAHGASAGIVAELAELRGKLEELSDDRKADLQAGMVAELAELRGKLEELSDDRKADLQATQKQIDKVVTQASQMQQNMQLSVQLMNQEPSQPPPSRLPRQIPSAKRSLVTATDDWTNDWTRDFQQQWMSSGANDRQVMDNNSQSSEVLDSQRSESGGMPQMPPSWSAGQAEERLPSPTQRLPSPVSSSGSAASPKRRASQGTAPA